MNRLLLRAVQGDPVEKIYYTAVYLAQTDRMKEYYHAWQENPTPHYWYHLFREKVNRETVLISAAINVCDVPFGAYTVEKWDEDEIEISPWLFSSKFNRQEMMDRIFSGHATEDDLRIYEHSLLLTIGFITWMDAREEQRQASKARQEFSPMRVAMLGMQAQTAHAAEALWEMWRCMANLGAQVTAYNPRHSLLDEKRDVGNGLQAIRMPSAQGKGRTDPLYAVLSALHASLRHYDIYHFHSLEACSMLWLPHMLGKRTVVTVSGQGMEKTEDMPLSVRLGQKMALRYADEIIVQSETMQRTFASVHKRSTALISSGLTRRLVGTDSLINAKYGLSRGEYVLFRSDIVPNKGLHYLLEAFAGVKTALQLVVAGAMAEDDAYAQQIRDMADQDARVLLVGDVQGQELSELLANCRVYVLPSDREETPLNLLEAVSYGACCLVSDIAENVETAKGSMRMFAHGSIQSLRENLQDLLDTNAAPIPLEGLWESWDKVAEKTLQVYTDVLNKYPPRLIARASNP